MGRLRDAIDILRGNGKIERDSYGNFSYWLGGNPDFSIGSKLGKSLTNPALFTAFDMRSTMFSRAVVKVVDDNDKEIESDPFIDLLANPNYCESQQDFLKKHLWYKGLGTGMTKVVPKALNRNLHDIGNVAALEHLIPSQVDYKSSNKQREFIISSSEIKSIEDRKIVYKLSGEEHEIKIGEIAFFYDIACNMKENGLFKSPSRMDALVPEICNIEEALRAKNKNLIFAAKWLASNKAHEMGVSMPLENDQKHEIEKGLFNKSMTATNTEIDVVNLSGDFRKLMLDDNIASDAMRIFGAYGINKDVINWWMNGQTTYDNKQYGIVDWIQNSIQLEADDFANTWTTFFGYRDLGKRIVLDYKHLPIMQVLETKRMEGISKQATILKTLIDSGVSLDNALRISGLDETEA